MPTLLESLRTVTREQHRELESALDIQSKLDSRARYRDLLAGFLGLYRPIEAEFRRERGIEELGYRIDDRQKQSALEYDLEQLGFSPEEIAALPNATVPELTNQGDALGRAYVVEGSTLGGQAITRLVGASHPQFPISFFNVYGARTREQWVDFQQSLERYEAAGGSTSDVTAGAVRTFELFRRWLA